MVHLPESKVGEEILHPERSANTEVDLASGEVVMVEEVETEIEGSGIPCRVVAEMVVGLEVAIGVATFVEVEESDEVESHLLLMQMNALEGVVLG